MEFLDREVEALIRVHSREEDGSGARHSKGANQIRDRLTAIARLCAKRLPGDFIEIGCHVGKTTVRLAEIADRYDKRVIAVDPWKKGTQNCRGGEYGKFLNRMEPYAYIVDIVRKKSQSPEAIEYIKSRQICFAFVDGLHTYRATKKDIETVSHCRGVIAVDDIRWKKGVRKAFREFDAQRKIVYDHIREGYIVITP